MDSAIIFDWTSPFVIILRDVWFNSFISSKTALFLHLANNVDPDQTQVYKKW